MTNAVKFKQIFRLYATELWAKPEKEFLKWLNSEAESDREKGKWIDHSAAGYVECPVCHTLTHCDDNIDELHFCFWCGGEMESGAPS